MSSLSSIVSVGLRASYGGEMMLDVLRRSENHFVCIEGKKYCIALGVCREEEYDTFDIERWQGLRRQHQLMALQEKDQAQLDRLPFFFLTSDFDPLGYHDQSWGTWGKQRIYLPKAMIYYEEGNDDVELIFHLSLDQQGIVIENQWDLSSMKALDFLKLNQGILCAGLGVDHYEMILSLLFSTDLSRHPQDEPLSHRFSRADVKDDQDLAQWTLLIENAKKTIGLDPSHGIQKLVCARKGLIDFDPKQMKLDRVESFKQICQKFKGIQGISCFWVQRKLCFMGATPEVLIEIADQQIKTHALAGTIKITDMQQLDVLGNQLLNDPKERKEHAMVVAQILENLADCTSLTWTQEPTLKRAGQLLHLETLISAENDQRDEYQMLSLIKALHPTPALGGKPKSLALAWLRENERLHRGNYGAPLGWLNAHTVNGLYAKLIVGIRSFLYDEKQGQIHLFGGVGIVAESNAEKEWQESLMKMTALIDQLRLVRG